MELLEQGVLPIERLDMSNYLKALVLRDLETRGLLTDGLKSYLLGSAFVDGANTPSQV